MATSKHVRRGRAVHRVVALFITVTALSIGTTVISEEDYVGADTCAACHEEISDAFAHTVHGRETVKAWNGASTCEACHGPGQAHAEEGEAALILGGKTEEGTEMCVTCHSVSTTTHWQASTHDEFGVQCADCHNPHQPWAAQSARRNEDITQDCLSCHQDMRKHLYQRSSHPLQRGQMSCISCHDPHGSTAEAAMAAITPNDKCYECHAEKRGPFLFEHQPVREDCSTCHDPHGSNQTMLLQTSAPRLCQSCHLFGHHQTVPGEPTQIWNQNRSCTNCHYRIHGSNHPSGVVFLR